MKTDSITILEVEAFASMWAERTCRNDTETQESVENAVRKILADVRNRGDEAIMEYTTCYDKVKQNKFLIDRADLQLAYEAVCLENPGLITALEDAKKNIARFAELQISQCSNFKTMVAPGVVAGQRVLPVRRAGIYVPGGRYPLVSSVLMGVIPARIAGVSEVFVATPPKADGIPDKRILAAAFLAGATAVYVMGGAQAIGALAFGTESIPRVDVIAGPGNAYVAEAKRQVFGHVGIDLVAGPTDVLIIADDKACRGAGARLIALDMIAQAEHDTRASAILLVPGKLQARAVLSELEAELGRRACEEESSDSIETAKEALKANGLIVLYDTIEEALALANTIAPEHLELHCCNAESLVSKLVNYGSLFIGMLAGEVLGDYAAGINHTLPTGGSSRFTGGLSVKTFIKTVTTLSCDRGPGYERLLNASIALAEAEGLAGHRRSAEARLSLHESS